VASETIPPITPPTIAPKFIFVFEPLLPEVEVPELGLYLYKNECQAHVNFEKYQFKLGVTKYNLFNRWLAWD
jgi:hypothetical protein